MMTFSLGKLMNFHLRMLFAKIIRKSQRPISEERYQKSDIRRALSEGIWNKILRANSKSMRKA